MSCGDPIGVWDVVEYVRKLAGEGEITFDNGQVCTCTGDGVGSEVSGTMAFTDGGVYSQSGVTEWEVTNYYSEQRVTDGGCSCSSMGCGRDGGTCVCPESLGRIPWQITGTFVVNGCTLSTMFAPDNRNDWEFCQRGDELRIELVQDPEVRGRFSRNLAQESSPDPRR